MGPGGRPRVADPRGGAPRSSRSSAVLRSRSPSSAVRLAPCRDIKGKTFCVKAGKSVTIEILKQPI